MLNQFTEFSTQMTDILCALVMVKFNGQLCGNKFNYKLIFLSFLILLLCDFVCDYTVTIYELPTISINGHQKTDHQ